MTYAYLLEGAISGLECSICLQMVGVDFSKLAERLVPEANALRRQVGGRFFRGEYVLRRGQTRRPPIGKFEQFIKERLEEKLTDDLVALIVKGGENRSAADNTWIPDFSIEITQQGRMASDAAVPSAFVHLPASKSSADQMEAAFVYGWAACSFDVGRIFHYPREFSPGSYDTGLVYVPHKRFGRPTERDADRVTNASNHLFRGLLPSQGYAAEVGEVMYVNAIKPELARLREALSAWTTETRLCDGKLSRFTLPIGELRDIQDDLDRRGLLLAGFPPPRGRPA